jgi:hypothetical protein
MGVPGAEDEYESSVAVTGVVTAGDLDGVGGSKEGICRELMLVSIAGGVEVSVT